MHSSNLMLFGEKLAPLQLLLVISLVIKQLTSFFLEFLSLAQFFTPWLMDGTLDNGLIIPLVYLTRQTVNMFSHLLLDSMMAHFNFQEVVKENILMDLALKWVYVSLSSALKPMLDFIQKNLYLAMQLESDGKQVEQMKKYLLIIIWLLIMILLKLQLCLQELQ